MTLYEEWQKMNRLNESNEVRRALYGDYRHKIKTFGIFTAENPLGNSLAPDENNRLTNQLKGILSKSHLQYVPISGMCDIGDEHSFLVINISLDECKQICGKFGQKSFFFGTNYWGVSVPTQEDEASSVDSTTTSCIEYWETPATKFSSKDKENGIDPQSYKLVEKSRRIDNAQDFDNFFSRHKNFKYSIYMKIFNENYDKFYDILDMEAFNESYNPKKTFMYRSMSRRQAYTNYLGK